MLAGEIGRVGAAGDPVRTMAGRALGDHIGQCAGVNRHRKGQQGDGAKPARPDSGQSQGGEPQYKIFTTAHDEVVDAEVVDEDKK